MRLNIATVFFFIVGLAYMGAANIADKLTPFYNPRILKLVTA